MSDFIRPQIVELEDRIRQKRQFIQVIIGPRQVGKTTLALQLMDRSGEQSHYASADGIGPGVATWIGQQWETARLKLKQSESKYIILVFDEIQKIPGWSEYVKAEWDQDSRTGLDIRVLLLGSSRLLLQQGLSESLAGRYELHQMTHWSFTEMQTAFGFKADQYVWFGGYPGAAPLIADEARWRNYVRDALIEPSISKDIFQLTRVDKPALLKSLFELGCLYSGQILSFNKILGQLQDAGNTTTLSHYLRLLDQAGLLSGLNKYSPNVIRQRKSSPKFQVYNMALYSAQTNDEFPTVRSKSEKWGRWVEAAIGAHLLNYSIRHGYQIYYWRENNNEVDFVLVYNDRLIAVEVKSSAASATTGMRQFRIKFNPEKIYLTGMDGLAWEDFLSLDPLDLF